MTPAKEQQEAEQRIAEIAARAENESREVRRSVRAWFITKEKELAAKDGMQYFEATDGPCEARAALALGPGGAHE